MRDATVLERAHPGLPPGPTFDKRGPIRKVTAYFSMRRPWSSSTRR